MTCLSLSVLCQGGQIYLIRSSKKKEVHQSYQLPPRFCGHHGASRRSLEDEKFLPIHGSWSNIPYLMHSGDATHIMATWRVLINRVNASVVWLLCFPLNFSFFSLVFKLPFSLCPFTFSNFFTIIALCSFFYDLFHLAIFIELRPMVASFEVCFLFSLSFCFLWHRFLCKV